MPRECLHLGPVVKLAEELIHIGAGEAVVFDDIVIGNTQDAEKHCRQDAGAVFAHGAVEDEGMVFRIGDYFQRGRDSLADFLMPDEKKNN